MDNHQQIKSELTLLRIIFGALAMGQILFVLVAHFVIRAGQPVEEPEFVMKMMVPGLLFLASVGGFQFFAAQMKKIPADHSLVQKLKAYKTATISHLAIIEGAVLFAIVNYLLSGYMQFLTLAAVGLLWFLIQYPSVSTITRNMKLNEDERRSLTDQ